MRGTEFDDDDRLVSQVSSEVRGLFAPPRRWLAGVAANLVMALLYLSIVPLTGHHHRNWVVLLGTYLGTFILADVTSTNILGIDLSTVRRRLADGLPIQRILLVKNIGLLLLIAVPTLVLTAALTVNSEPPSRLFSALPAVAYPMILWASIGNIASVLLPVRPVGIRTRWRERRQLRTTIRWLVHLAVPYVLLYPILTLGHMPNMLIADLPKNMRTPEVRGLTFCVIAGLVWVVGIRIATRVAALPRFDLVSASG